MYIPPSDRLSTCSHSEQMWGGMRKYSHKGNSAIYIPGGSCTRARLRMDVGQSVYLRSDGGEEENADGLQAGCEAVLRHQLNHNTIPSRLNNTAYPTNSTTLTRPSLTKLQLCLYVRIVPAGGEGGFGDRGLEGGDDVGGTGGRGGVGGKGGRSASPGCTCCIVTPMMPREGSRLEVRLACKWEGRGADRPLLVALAALSHQ